MFENYRTFETTYAGRPVKVETGKTCGLANGSCWVRYGETVVMANVTASAKPREGVDFFPLSVDFEEKMYSVGKIPGSFTKREGKASDKAILASRCVDRPIRPLFPKDMRNDVTVVITVLSVEPDNSPEIAGMIAASIAISISDIPWNGPVASINVGYVDGQLVLNPTLEQRAHNDLNLTVAGSADKVVMIEAGANEIPDDLMLEAIKFGHAEIKNMVAFISDIQKQIGKPKFEFESMELDHDMMDKILDQFGDKLKYALDTDDKTVRDARLVPIQDEILETFSEEYENLPDIIGEVMYKAQKTIVREWLYNGKRVDGPVSDAQKLDGIDEETSKRYMHQYNFPSYSVGETKPSRGPGRREIGHGALAERALVPVIPSVEEFPYAIRCVSEVLSSNGSTSQGSICGYLLRSYHQGGRQLDDNGGYPGP